MTSLEKNRKIAGLYCKSRAVNISVGALLILSVNKRQPNKTGKNFFQRASQAMLRIRIQILTLINDHKSTFLMCGKAINTLGISIA
jgi:hypothetical protein